MSEADSQRETLESWKQIAAYLNRSERTVRRWEASEGLPVHRRGHQKQDTILA
jgi:DNA-binding transcriptional regulator YiaG